MRSTFALLNNFNVLIFDSNFMGSSVENRAVETKLFSLEKIGSEILLQLSGAGVIEMMIWVLCIGWCSCVVVDCTQNIYSLRWLEFCPNNCYELTKNMLANSQEFTRTSVDSILKKVWKMFFIYLTSNCLTTVITSYNWSSGNWTLENFIESKTALSMYIR